MKKTVMVVLVVFAIAFMLSVSGYCRTAPMRIDSLGNTVPTRTVSPQEPRQSKDQLGKKQKKSVEQEPLVDYKYDARGNKVPVSTVEEGTFMPDREKEMDNFERKSGRSGETKINALGKEVPEKVR